MQQDKKIHVALLVDEEWYTAFFVTLAKILGKTGEIDPVLAVCLDKTPDPADDCIRLAERGGGAPSHEYDWDDLTGYEHSLSDVDDYFKGRHQVAARSLCVHTEQWLEKDAPDCLIVWSGTRLGPRSVAAAARAMGVPVVTLETPYFQKLPVPPETDAELNLHNMKNQTLIWDIVQAPQCGPSQLTRDWSRAEVRLGLQSFIEKLHQERSSKFSKEDIQRFLHGKTSDKRSPEAEDQPALELFKPPNTKALLVCGQVDRDSSMFFCNHLLSTWYELGMEVAKRLPKGWIMWFKGHPLDRSYASTEDEYAEELLSINPKCRVIPTTIDIQTCYAACDAVACINSTAGIEAMTHGLPVINMGRASYTHQGMTYSLEDLDELNDVLQELPSHMTEAQIALRDRFLSYVLYDYLIPVGSPAKMLQRIRQAMAESEADRLDIGE